MLSFRILIAATGFIVALAVTLGAAGAFAARLDRLGAGLELKEVHGMPAHGRAVAENQYSQIDHPMDVQAIRIGRLAR